MIAEFRILGPVEVGLGSASADLAGGRVRALLCLLLVHRGAVVPADAIVDALWDDRPPANAPNAVQVVVSRLRRAIGAGLVVTHGTGYQVALEPGALDADRFAGLLDRGRDERAGKRPAEAGATLRAAEALWRGPALADVRDAAFARAEIARLEALRRECIAERIEADLEAGAAAGMVAGELQALLRDHPHDERLWRLLMLALYRAGRPADALAAYREARRSLLDGLGLEPSPELRTLEAEILRHDVAAPATARESSDEVRRQVTCVYTRLAAADADPEALRAAAGAHHAAARASALRHGGDIAQLRPDGALLVFGSAMAHEDDPLRAVRAALEIAAARAEACCVGVATGVVVTSGRPGDPAVFGRPATEAAAIADEPGAVLLAVSTRELVEHAARGGDRPGGRYRVEHVADDAPAITRSLGRPLVGRDEELAALRAAYGRARDRRAWVRATVVGEPGIGKSRMAAELHTRLSEATVLAGSCPPYGEGTTYRPLREAILDLCAGRPVTALAEVAGVDEAVAARVATAIGLGPAPAGGDDPAWAVRRLLTAIAGDAPVALIVDDIQWAQPGLLDLLDEVTAEGEAGAGGLLVCLARPELLDARPDWPGRGQDDVLIDLRPLTPAQSRALLDSVGSAALDDPARSRIAEVASGNPLFLEQLASYAEEHAAESALPPALKSLLAARLDLLDPAERAVLCYGAVAGDGFAAASVHALAEGAPAAEIDAACASLAARNLLAGDVELRFRHALIREAAYRSLSKAARARLHERRASWLAEHRDDRADADAAIAFQLERAHRCAHEIGAAGEDILAARARTALATAARTAHRSGDLPGEIALLDRASGLPGAGGAERCELLPLLAAALFAAGSFDRATTVADEAVRLGGELGLERARVRGLVERERLRVYQGQATLDVAASLRAVDSVLATLERLGDDLGIARAHYLRAELAWMQGDPEAGGASAERMLEHGRRAGSGFEAAAAVGFMAWTLVQGLTPVAEGLERCDELAERFARDRVATLEVAGFRSVLSAMNGHIEDARERMAWSRAGLDGIGLTQASASMALFAAQLEQLAGDPAAAERAVRDADRITQRTGDRWFQSTVRVDLAHALLRQGTGDAAAAVLAIDEIPAPADAEWVIKRHAARALLASAEDDHGHAVAEARAAAAAADATAMLTFRADAHAALAEVLRAAGDPTGAADASTAARRLHEAKGNVAALARPVSRR